jgi:3-methyladenine DNA glycosylase AlkD
MTLREAMVALEKGANEQCRKTWARHGVPTPMFGVRYEDLYKLQKRIGSDSELARTLWITGNHDARILATLIVEPKDLAKDEIGSWIAVAEYRLLNDAVARVAAESTHAVALADVWRRDRSEWISAAGWTSVGVLAAGDKVTDKWLGARLEEAARGIHSAPNYARHCMYMALIATGGSRPALTARAIALAQSIGKVEVDHGDTACKTPDAVPYIKKLVARRKAKGRKPAPRRKKAKARRK